MGIIVTVRTGFKTSLAEVEVSKVTDIAVEDGQLLVNWSLSAKAASHFTHLKSPTKGAGS